MFLRFADQQMKVFGHDHIADDHKLIAPADLFEDLEKKIAALSAAQQGLATITTTGDEMQVSGAVVAVKAPGHETRLEPKPSSGRDGRTVKE
jgi:hypothetical protein